MSQRSTLPATPVTLFETALENGFFWIAACENRPLGYCLGALLEGLYYLHDIRVAEDARRQGVGSALLKQAMDQARFLYCATLVLPVPSEDQSLEPFARSNGFLLADNERLPKELGALHASRMGDHPRATITTMICRL